MTPTTNFDIVLPCYNPHPGWEKKVIDNMRALETRHPQHSFQVHIVDDGSTRGYEADVLQRLYEALPGVELVRYTPNRGKGYAVREGVRHCKNEYIIYTDYDFPYTPESLDKVIDTLLQGACVVVAVRGRSYQHKLSLWRRFLSASSHGINRFLFGLTITDTQGGMKGFDSKGREVFLSTTIDTFLFDTQFIRKASRRKDLTIRAIESSIRNGIHLSGMGFRVMLREGLNIVKICLDR